ncbi:MAG TPA: aminopeptidase [Burkholderiales bacterium]|nr:aminopeptidase [Burkholderiales bacterium]
MASARPVDEWLADPRTEPALRERLETARRIRDFASRRLGLPDNGSYTSYAELGRPYVVWNVFAAPRFSVEPKKECFPFTGCVAYRGFYSQDEAQRHAARLREQGYDVHVGGVPAYSTLGWFDDPLLSTFMRYPETQVARLVFHELAHQVAYAKNDTTFNESFAVVVEEVGVRRWLKQEGRLAELASFQAAQARKREFASRVKQTRERLAELYRSDLPQEAMLAAKRAAYEQLRAAYPRIVPAEANNAFLLSIALYTDLVPAFESLLAESGSLEKFYERVKRLAATERSIRDPWLAQRP